MVNHIQNRETIIKSLREELVGPFPQGEQLDTSNLPIKFDKKEDSYGPWRQMGTAEEILLEILQQSDMELVYCIHMV